MKTRFAVVFLFVFLIAQSVTAQEVQTLFGSGKCTGGYGALTNKFTTIGGEFANISEVYGGVFINRRWMLGLAFAGSTNDIRVPVEYSISPQQPMTYQYGQGGLKLERVIGSNKPIHLVLDLFTGVGFTAQYDRYNWHANDFNTFSDHDENWFYVVEPGVQLEMNLFRWMRLSPGISYRNTSQSNSSGLKDSDLSNWSYNVTLKFGGFGKRNRITYNTENSVN
ncbi:MAG: hypothetical protein JNM78_18335 [Cyclobacteriaceae bacterium]|nr:hypothetical protein [Cyclobacteriaceae bacterium]